MTKIKSAIGKVRRPNAKQAKAMARKEAQRFSQPPHATVQRQRKFGDALIRGF